MDYQELCYKCPEITPQHAADRALQILEAAERTDEGFVAHLLQASNVLLLAGLRAQAPLSGLPLSMSAERLQACGQLLQGFDIAMVDESSEPAGEAGGNGYSLFNKPVFAQLPSIYQILPREWEAPAGFAYGDFSDWTLRTTAHLARSMQGGALPEVWLKDWMAPHNACAGMLQGDPGPAIASSLWANAIDITEGRTMPLDTVTFESPQPIRAQGGFHIAPQAKQDPEVVKFVALCNDVLAIVARTIQPSPAPGTV